MIEDNEPVPVIEPQITVRWDEYPDLLITPLLKWLQRYDL